MLWFLQAFGLGAGLVALTALALVVIVFVLSQFPDWVLGIIFFVFISFVIGTAILESM